MTLIKKYTTGFVISKDGTKIGYRKMGTGAGLILVHGGMMASQNFMKLAELLSDEFTVYVPDRQGRGFSASHKDGYGLTAESEDIQALANETSTENIFGLSSGAIITLQTALIDTGIKKIALYEPPLLIDTTKPIAWADNYNAAMNKGNLGRAFISIVKGTDDPSSFFNKIPAFMIAPLLNLAINNEAKKAKENSDDVHLKSLLSAMAYDIKVVEDSKGLIEKVKDLRAEVLLLSGQKSQPFLKETIDTLSKTLPHATHKELIGQGHTAADNNGKPELVAEVLGKFFRDGD